MDSNSLISKKEIQENLSLGNTAVKKAIDYLIVLDIVSQGHNGKKNGWTVNKQFTIVESYFD